MYTQYVHCVSGATNEAVRACSFVPRSHNTKSQSTDGYPGLRGHGSSRSLALFASFSSWVYLVPVAGGDEGGERAANERGPRGGGRGGLTRCTAVHSSSEGRILYFPWFRCNFPRPRTRQRFLDSFVWEFRSTISHLSVYHQHGNCLHIKSAFKGCFVRWVLACCIVLI